MQGSPSVSLKTGGSSGGLPFSFLGLRGNGGIRVRGFITFLLSAVLVLEIVAVGALSQTVNSIWVPGDRVKTELFVHEGDSYHRVVQEVAEATSLESPRVLSAYGLANGLDRRIKKGRYRIENGWTPAQALEQTVLGPNDPLRVKILPGLTLRDCARTIQQSGWIESASSWISLASPSGKIAPLGKPNYEGLLAPETYFFDSPENPAKVLEKLHSHWKEFIHRVTGTDDLTARLRNGLTLYDTVILASIIEKEAADPIQMATAASVFHNRLRKNWPLGSAATLRYLMGPWKGRDDQLPVNTKSPFNTSRRPGLPPTPICIPSEAALMASISPPETKFLFFSGDGDGGLVFNKTHDGHKSSVSKYRKKIEQRERQAAIAASVTDSATGSDPLTEKTPAISNGTN
jgi:UPF0755 protein